eukprot:3684459-Amphidinium_carterae.1
MRKLDKGIWGGLCVDFKFPVCYLSRRNSNRNKKGKGARTNLIRIPKELEDFVLPTDPTNLDRTRIALSKPTGKTGELFKKIAFLIEIYAKQQNSRFARSGIASTGVAIQMGAKTGRGT